MSAIAMFLWIAAASPDSDSLATLREQIKGREELPATEVFKNIQVLKKMPAGRLLSVMEMGYARSLGVGCVHCHMPGKWDDDAKAPKQIAREMSLMVRRINGELLPNTGLKERNSVVNCTTCHRGEVKPALDLAAASPGPGAP
jgi:hypothetical protein